MKLNEKERELARRIEDLVAEALRIIEEHKQLGSNNIALQVFHRIGDDAYISVAMTEEDQWNIIYHLRTGIRQRIGGNNG